MRDRTAATLRAEPHNGDGTLRGEDVPLSQLLRELANDGRRLVRDEIDLAKLELRQTARSTAVDGALMGGGALVGAFGAACLVAALVIGGGILLGSYGLSALIVGLLLVAGGGLAVMTGLRRLRSERITPEKTVESLREDVAWVGDEMRAIRRDWSRS